MAGKYRTLPTIVERAHWKNRKTTEDVAIAVGAFPWVACPWVFEEDAQDWELIGLHYRFQAADGRCYLPGGRYCVTLAEAEDILACCKKELEDAGYTVA